jgi:CheY-like chemotaxis protein
MVESSQATSEGVRILLAEDEAAVAEVLTSALQNAGYGIHVARTGDEALEIFMRDPTFDLLLTDVVMPGKLQGTHLSRELRAICPSLPVIFMSGYSSEATVHGNSHRSEDVRLMKPVRRSDLITAVESLIVSNR